MKRYPLDGLPVKVMKAKGTPGMNETKDGITELEVSSRPFVGQWNRLISTTNWEKGQIILAWREAMASSGATNVEYSDEAWAQRVGGISGQHVGRLRRVYDRFGSVFHHYEGLYWSHFQTALDWDDAEMWLEGAMQNRWSVANMRQQRSETLGLVETTPPEETAVFVAEFDEELAAGSDRLPSDRLTETTAAVRSTESAPQPTSEPLEEATVAADSAERVDLRPRPFEDLARLPDDVVEAFESFKLAILRHKIDGWQAISKDDMLQTLDALKELALAPADLGPAS